MPQTKFRAALARQRRRIFWIEYTPTFWYRIIALPMKLGGSLSEMYKPREEEDKGFRRLYEDYAYVLDYLPYGRSSPDRSRHFAAPTVQVLGENYFTLLEVELKPGTTVAMHDRIYVGKERREKVSRVIGRISYEELTATAKAELMATVEEMVRNKEQQYVDFFNKAQAVTPRMHMLELLPSIGKKSMWQILDEREKKLFESFKDIQGRAGVTDPVKIIAKRIVEELSEEPKYRIFTRTF